MFFLVKVLFWLIVFIFKLYTHTHTHTYINIYIYIYGERAREKNSIVIILSYIVIAFELFISYENFSYCYWIIQTQRKKTLQRMEIITFKGVHTCVQSLQETTIHKYLS